MIAYNDCFNSLLCPLLFNKPFKLGLSLVHSWFLKKDYSDQKLDRLEVRNRQPLINE